MSRRSSSLIIILIIAACSKGQRHPPNADTVSLLRSVVKYAADTLKVGPRIVISRTTRANPNVRMSLETENALLSSDSALSAVERYDVVHRACEYVAKAPTNCRFTTADGVIGIRNVQVWRDSARVGIEYYRTKKIVSPAAAGQKSSAQASGKTTLVFSTGDASLERDAEGHWRVRKFTETGGTAR